MELIDALAIVIDLARDNALEEYVAKDEVLQMECEKQWEAIEEVESHLRDLRMKV